MSDRIWQALTPAAQVCLENADFLYAKDEQGQDADHLLRPKHICHPSRFHQLQSLVTAVHALTGITQINVFAVDVCWVIFWDGSKWAQESIGQEGFRL